MTVLAPPPLDQPLSTAMREGSRQEHRDAEGSRFMESLLGGRLGAAGYLEYLRHLRRIYVALEAVGEEHREDELIGAVYDTALNRLAAIDADIAYWSVQTGASHTAEPLPSPTVDAYVARIEQSARWGGEYVAHHYTRYLGDLSGGQAIGRIMAREFDLHDDQGTAFYAFPEIPRPKPYKDAYRASLDGLPLDAEDKGRVVEEVKVAFNLNQALFAELDHLVDDHPRTPRD